MIARAALAAAAICLAALPVRAATAGPERARA